MPSPWWRRQIGSNVNNDGNGEGYGGANYGDDSYDDGYNGPTSFWWSPTGIAVRYAIVALVLAVVLLFFVGGYYHAQRRLRNGLPLRRYHAWMLRSAHLPNTYARYQSPSSQGCPGEIYLPPPPAYHHNEAPPPVYQPPEGGCKSMTDPCHECVREDTHYAGEGSDGVGVAALPAVARQ